MSEERKVIKFSHHYPKLYKQTSGKLIAIEHLYIDDREDIKKLLDYDTNIDGSDNRFPIYKGETYMQLVFVGNYHIPFCTLRRMINQDRIETKDKEIASQIYSRFIKTYYSVT